MQVQVQQQSGVNSNLSTDRVQQLVTTSGAFWQTNFSALDADYASRFFSPTIPDDPSFTELKFTGACLPFSVFAIPTVLLGVGIPSEEAFGMGVFFFPSASAEPLFDTIRGGSLIVLHGDVALVDEKIGRAHV